MGDRDAKIMAELTDDAAVLERALDTVMNGGSNGSASFYAGMRRANQSLIASEDLERESRKIVLFMSDTAGQMYRRDPAGMIEGLSARMAVAAREAKRHNIVFNTFGLTERSGRWHALSLGLIALSTGGSYHVVEDPQTLYCHLVDSLARAPSEPEIHSQL